MVNILTNEELLNKLEELATPQKEILTIREASEVTGLSVSRLYTLTCYKKIPHYKLNGKELRFKRSELEAWLTRDRVATNEEIRAAVMQYDTKKKKGARR